MSCQFPWSESINRVNLTAKVSRLCQEINIHYGLEFSNVLEGKSHLGAGAISSSQPELFIGAWTSIMQLDIDERSSIHVLVPGCSDFASYVFQAIGLICYADSRPPNRHMPASPLVVPDGPSSTTIGRHPTRDFRVGNRRFKDQCHRLIGRSFPVNV